MFNVCVFLYSMKNFYIENCDGLGGRTWSHNDVILSKIVWRHPLIIKSLLLKASAPTGIPVLPDLWCELNSSYKWIWRLANKQICKHNLTYLCDEIKNIYKYGPFQVSFTHSLVFVLKQTFRLPCSNLPQWLYRTSRAADYIHAHRKTTWKIRELDHKTVKETKKEKGVHKKHNKSRC